MNKKRVERAYKERDEHTLRLISTLPSQIREVINTYTSLDTDNVWDEELMMGLSSMEMRIKPVASYAREHIMLLQAERQKDYDLLARHLPE
jgi:hypothetical protein